MLLAVQLTVAEFLAWLSDYMSSFYEYMINNNDK